MRRTAAGLLAALVTLSLPAAAMAASPGYRYIEGGRNNIDVDDFNQDGDGWFVGASLGIGKNAHIFGRYITNETDGGIDLEKWYAGAGWHGMLGEKADIVGELAYVDASTKHVPAAPNVSEDGFLLRGGVRWRPIKLFELEGFLKHEDTDGSEIGYEANALVNIWRLGIGLGVEDVDDVQTFNGFVRFNFGGS